jgi:hypothetical protein
MNWSFSKNNSSLFLFLTQEKKQKNMHLKRIAKSSLHFGKKNNSSSRRGGIRQTDFSSFPSFIPFRFYTTPKRRRAGAILLMCEKHKTKGWTFGHFDFYIGQEFLFQNVQVSKVVN